MLEVLTVLFEEPLASSRRVEMSRPANDKLCRLRGLIGVGNMRSDQSEWRDEESPKRGSREHEIGGRFPDKTQGRVRDGGFGEKA
jgi:hypothetical protein